MTYALKTWRFLVGLVCLVLLLAAHFSGVAQGWWVRFQDADAPEAFSAAECTQPGSEAIHADPVSAYVFLFDITGRARWCWYDDDRFDADARWALDLLQGDAAELVPASGDVIFAGYSGVQGQGCWRSDAVQCELAEMVSLAGSRVEVGTVQGGDGRAPAGVSIPALAWPLDAGVFKTDDYSLTARQAATSSALLQLSRLEHGGLQGWEEAGYGRVVIVLLDDGNANVDNSTSDVRQTREWKLDELRGLGLSSARWTALVNSDARFQRWQGLVDADLRGHVSLGPPVPLGGGVERSCDDRQAGYRTKILQSHVVVRDFAPLPLNQLTPAAARWRSSTSAGAALAAYGDFVEISLQLPEPGALSDLDVVTSLQYRLGSDPWMDLGSGDSSRLEVCVDRATWESWEEAAIELRWGVGKALPPLGDEALGPLLADWLVLSAPIEEPSWADAAGLYKAEVARYQAQAPYVLALPGILFLGLLLWPFFEGDPRGAAILRLTVLELVKVDSGHAAHLDPVKLATLELARSRGSFVLRRAARWASEPFLARAPLPELRVEVMVAEPLANGEVVPLGQASELGPERQHELCVFPRPRFGQQFDVAARLSRDRLPEALALDERGAVFRFSAGFAVQAFLGERELEVVELSSLEGQLPMTEVEHD